MKRTSYIILAGLLVVVAVTYFITSPTDTEEVTFQAPDIQLTLDPAKIIKIEVNRAGRFMRLERIVGVWRVTVPVNYIADDEAINQLIDGMAKFRLLGLVSTNPEKQNVFQVNEQGTTLIMTDEEGKTISLVVGKSAPNPKQSYVRPMTAGSVYIAQGLLPEHVNRDLRDWRQRTIYRTDVENVQVVTIKSGGEKFALKRRDNRWVAEGKTVPTKIMKEAIAELTYVRAEDFIDTALIITNAPKFQVEVMGDGLVRMDFYSQPGGRDILKTSGSSSLFVVSRNLSQKVQSIVDELTRPPEVTEAPSMPPEPKPTTAQPATQTQAAKETRPTMTTTQPFAGSIEESGVLTIHTVKRGETLASIAQQYNVTVDQIKKWNLLEKPTVPPGSELYVFVKKKK